MLGDNCLFCLELCSYAICLFHWYEDGREEEEFSEILLFLSFGAVARIEHSILFPQCSLGFTKSILGDLGLVGSHWICAGIHGMVPVLSRSRWRSFVSYFFATPELVGHFDMDYLASSLHGDLLCLATNVAYGGVV